MFDWTAGILVIMSHLVLVVDCNNITAILNRLVDNYDRRLRPNYGGRPVEVGVTIHISTISAVSEVEMDFTLDLYLRQYWQDPRLEFEGTNESLSVGAEMADNIWVPDTFFPNEKKSFFHEATTPNSFLRISPSGSVLRSLRLTVTAMCPMDLIYFPLDKQKCSLEIESYGYSTKDTVYYWKDGNTSVDVSEDIHLAQFTVGNRDFIERTIKLSTGNYSRLSAYFTFSRNIGFYLIQIYLPSSLIVIISWVSFWLNREATQARVAIGVTTVLTMTTLMTSTNSAMPKVSYVKSIDVYLGTCFIIVFASLLEYAAVGYMMKRMRMKRETCDSQYSTVMQPYTATYTNTRWGNDRRLKKRRSHGASESAETSELSPLMNNNRRLGGALVSSSQVPNDSKYSPSCCASEPGSSAPLLTPKVGPPRTSRRVPKCDCDLELGNHRTMAKPIRLAPRRYQDNFKPSSIDKYSRIFFPLTFISFHVIYWTVYMNAVDLL